MLEKKLGLVGYTARYFLSFARGLEAAGFEVYWIVALRSDALRLRRQGIPPHRILDTSPAAYERLTPEQCAETLATLEQLDGPRVRDVILMDRMLRRRPHDFALRYLAGVAKMVGQFLEQQDIRVISSGRDTALQMITMLVCRRNGRLWVVPTRTRLPRDRYGFMTTHECSTYVRLHEVTEAHRSAARQCLEDFRGRRLVPAARFSARGFGDVLRRVPMHLRLFGWALADAVYDRGNAFSRYTLPDLVRMWLRRRRNLIGLKVTRPYDAIGTRPYLLYALHTQPESSIDVAGSFFADQLALVGQIARATPVTHDLFVKAHPSDIDGKPGSFYRALRRIPGVRLIHPLVDSRELLSRASLVLTVTGTIAYEAGLLGIPAVTFAPLYFNALPSVRHCDSPRELPALINSLLQMPRPPGDDRPIIDFLAQLYADSVPGEFNRIEVPLTHEDLGTLCSVYEHLLSMRFDAMEEGDALVGRR